MVEFQIEELIVAERYRLVMNQGRASAQKKCKRIANKSPIRIARELSVRFVSVDCGLTQRALLPNSLQFALRLGGTG